MDFARSKPYHALFPPFYQCTVLVHLAFHGRRNTGNLGLHRQLRICPRGTYGWNHGFGIAELMNDGNPFSH